VFDIDLVLGLSRGGTDRAGPDLEQIRPPGQHLLLAHPHDGGLETGPATAGADVATARTVAPADVHLVGQRDCDGPADHGLGEIAVEGDSRATVLSRPEGSTRTRSPGRTVPPTTMPEKPRKSWSGRLTHCTGIRKGPSV